MKQLLFLLISALGFTACSKKSLFWEVSGNGTKKTSYLYGTMHTGDKRVYDFPSGTTEAFNNADLLALELNMDSVNQLSIMSELMMPGDTTLETLMSDEDYDLVANYFKDSLGQPLALFNKMSPMFTSSMVATKDMGNEMGQALDMYWYTEAKKLDKRIVGLEKADEQIRAFKSIPYSEQARGLVETVKSEYNQNVSTTADNQSDKLMDYYLSGDIDKMAKISQEMGFSDASIDESFNNAFLVNRNVTMVERAIPLLKDNACFIAVGAAHLGGKTGIIQLLKDRGYTVKPVSKK